MRMRTIVVRAVVLLVVLAATGSLAGCGSSAPSPTSSSAATASSAINPSAASAVTARPTATPGGTTGTIVFGTTIDAATKTVASPIATAALASPFGWVAHLSEPAKDANLTLTVAGITANGNENPVSSTTVAVSDPQAKDLVHEPDRALAALGGGQFTLRYIRPSDGTVLAKGTITFTN
jgi:hypothetical protein